MGPFCAACGQEHAAAADLTTSATLREIVANFVPVDGSAVRAAADLVLRPGQLTVDFLAGRRARHPSPAGLYVVVNFVFFVAVQWFDPVPALMVRAFSDAVGPGRYAAAEAASPRSPALFAAAVEERYADLLASMLVMLVPVVALVLWALYGRRRPGAAPHIVFAFHAVAFLLVALLPGTLLPVSLADPYNGAVLYAAVPLWSALALHRVYDGRVAWTVVRAALLWATVILALIVYMVSLASWAVATAE